MTRAPASSREHLVDRRRPDDSTRAGAGGVADGAKAYRARRDRVAGADLEVRCHGEQHAVAVDHLAAVGEIQRRHRDLLGGDVLPHVAARSSSRAERRESVRRRSCGRYRDSTARAAGCCGSHWPRRSRCENTRSLARAFSSSRRAPPIAASKPLGESRRAASRSGARCGSSPGRSLRRTWPASIESCTNRTSIVRAEPLAQTDRETAASRRSCGRCRCAAAETAAAPARRPCAPAR